MSPLVTPTTLTALIVALADLREEGTKLIPEVFLCENIDEMLKLLPGNEKIEIGSKTEPDKAIKEALKRCAPLAIGGWCLYISQTGEGNEYGLFRGSLNPLSISVNQTLFSEPMDQIKVVRLFRTASGCVEVTNQLGEVFSILLSDKPETGPLPDAYTRDLIDLICENVEVESKDATRTYVEKTLAVALAASHGTLIAVTGKKKLPKFLSDGVVLKSPINIADSVRAMLKEDSDVSAEHCLHADAALIRGMISSDGITVFSNTAQLLAYNCFVVSPNKIDGKAIIGGARTRAYQAMCSKVGTDLRGVFIQSQDGWTNFQRATNDQ